MSDDDQGGAGRREVAYRVFAAEYDDATLSYSESDEERAPNYVVLPTGARVNRLFVVGVLTEVEAASESVLRARIVDPTGAFVVYAGQYQPDALAFFEEATPPTFVALTGKARTFQPEDSDRTYSSIRPETANEVDAETRDRWTVQCARQTLDRIGTTARALGYEERGEDLQARLESDGVDVSLAAGIPRAIDHYGTTATYLDALRTVAVGALEVVAEERDEVDSLDVRPDESGGVEPRSLAADEPGLDPAAEPVWASPSGANAKTGAGTADGTADADPSGTGIDGSDGVDAGRPVGTGDEPGETEGRSTSVAGDGAEAGEGGPATGSTTDPSTRDEGATTEVAQDGESLEDFDPGEFELDDEEREEIEREFGTEFQSGSEVDEPGEADIETPDPDDGAGGSTTAESGESAMDASGMDSEPATDTEPATDSEPTGAEESGETADAVDMEDAVMDAMRAHDDGNGASVDDIVTAVVEDHGVDEADVTEAIQAALMDGRCYEPEDDVYKPI